MAQIYFPATPFPQRSRNSESSQHLNRLLQPVSSTASRRVLLDRIRELRSALAVTLAERDAAEAYVFMAAQEIRAHKVLLQGKVKKRARKVNVGPELSTSAERRTEDKRKKAEKRAELLLDPNHSFSGALKNKNKEQLTQIIASLHLPAPNRKDVKAKLLSVIEEHFDKNPNLKDLPTYIGIFQSTVHGQG